MYQISLKGVQIKELREENNKLKWKLVHNIEEKNKALGEGKQLQRKINDLNDRIIGKIRLKELRNLYGMDYQYKSQNSGQF